MTYVLHTFIMFVLAVSMLGCGGPSRVGKEMREAAYSRGDKVNARMAHEQATAAFETGQLEQARSMLADAIERYPDEPAWYTLMGRILMEQHRLDEARAVLEKAIELDDTSSENEYYLGVLYERWSKDALAANHFERACELEPDRPQYLLACAEALIACGRLDEAKAKIADRVEYFEHHAGLQHLQAQVAMLAGDHEAAIAHCESARLLEPRDHGMAHDLAHMQFAAGDWQSCLDTLRDMQLMGAEKSPAAERMEIRALMAAGRSMEARASLKQFCESQPTDASRWRDLGLLGWDIQDWSSVSQAARHLKAQGTWPYEAALFEALGWRGEGHLQRAETALESLTVRYPDRQESWAALVGVRMRMGDIAGSEKARKVVVKWQPDQADAHAVSGVYGTHGP